jgi:hypothetical protein
MVKSRIVGGKAGIGVLHTPRNSLKAKLSTGIIDKKAVLLLYYREKGVLILNNNKKNYMRTSLCLSKDMYEAINKMAVTKRVSASEYMRSCVEKALAVDGHKDGIDFIRKHIREELSNIINPKIERIIKLLVKSGVVSAAAYFLNAEMLAEFIPLSRQRDLEDALLESKKQGVVYFKLTDSELAEFANNENKIIDKFVRGGG